jgi:hypothetical protein
VKGIFIIADPENRAGGGGRKRFFTIHAALSGEIVSVDTRSGTVLNLVFIKKTVNLYRSF